MHEIILSIGIDIGTFTTQVVFTKLKIQNTAPLVSVPQISIIEKVTVFKSEIHQTPLMSSTLIDSNAIRKLVEADFQKAGFLPSDTSTGVVIITGEAARKENSQMILQSLSDFAGDFVVSSAGPDLESIIAGKGSGAFEYSLQHIKSVVNLDIGGGTTNIVQFCNGEVLSKGCVDIGGRQICLSPQGVVTYISKSAQCIAMDCGVTIAVGEKVETAKLELVCEKMAQLLWEMVQGKKSILLDDVKTKSSASFAPVPPIDTIFFSGGVSAGIYNMDNEDYEFGDIGMLLARKIRESQVRFDYQLLQGTETIGATVTGVSSFATTVSGSTIFYSSDIFPVKNIPVLKLSALNVSQASGENFAEIFQWFASQIDATSFLIALGKLENCSYSKIKSLAQAIAYATKNVSMEYLLLAVETDVAKALGLMVYGELSRQFQVVCIDSVYLNQGDFVDLGKPLMNGAVVPVVVKTLILG